MTWDSGSYRACLWHRTQRFAAFWTPDPLLTVGCHTGLDSVPTLSAVRWRFGRYRSLHILPGRIAYSARARRGRFAAMPDTYYGRNTFTCLCWCHLFTGAHVALVVICCAIVDLHLHTLQTDMPPHTHSSHNPTHAHPGPATPSLCHTLYFYFLFAAHITFGPVPLATLPPDSHTDYLHTYPLFCLTQSRETSDCQTKAPGRAPGGQALNSIQQRATFSGRALEKKT